MEIYQNQSLEDLPNETWRDIPSYEGIYQVSNLGRVKSLDRIIPFKNSSKRVKGTMLVQHLNFGYCQVSLGRNGKKHRVHRIVAEAFIPNPHDYPIINHKDENKKNNRVDNLEWCNYAYNLNYGSRKGWQRKLNGVPVYQYTKEGEFVARFDSMVEAAERTPSVTSNNIFHCCNKDKPSCGGFVWRYEGDKDTQYKNNAQTKVLQYDKNGHFVARFNSVKEASLATGVISTGISNCVAGLSLSSGGFIWKQDNGNISDVIAKYVKPTHKPIICYDKKGRKIKEYDSIADASRELNIASGSISYCCQGKLKSAGGYTWKYKD